MAYMTPTDFYSALEDAFANSRNNPQALKAFTAGAGRTIDQGKFVQAARMGMHPEVAAESYLGNYKAQAGRALEQMRGPMAPPELPNPPSWAPYDYGKTMQGAARQPGNAGYVQNFLRDINPSAPSGFVEPPMKALPPPSRPQLPMVRDPGFTMGGGSGAGGAERYARPIGPQEMRLLEGPKAAAKAAAPTAGALGARALMSKAASMYTPAAVAAGLTGSAMDLFDPESDVRTWGAPGRADFYRDLEEGNYLRAAGDFARANLMSGAAVAKNVAGAMLPVGPALDVLAGLVGGQRASAQEVPEARMPEQDGFIINDERIPEEARLNGGLNFIGTVGPGGSQVTSQDIQGAYERLNKQNRIAQAMSSLTGPQQREVLNYEMRQQRPMSWSDKLSQTLVTEIAANIDQQIQAEKDPAKRNQLRQQGLLMMARLAGRGNVQLENMNALQMQGDYGDN